MDTRFLNKKNLTVLVAVFALPVVVIILMAFIYSDGNSYSISFSGFQDLFTSLRLGELLKISERALIVCLLATIIAFIISYLVVTSTSSLFQSLFFILITIPFLVNEAVRVFSWQYVLSENGILNKFLSFITRQQIDIFNGSNPWNIYLVMIITCLPFGIFICSASLKTIPKIYWSTANDLNLNSFNRIFRIIIPLSKFALLASSIVIFFIAFSLSSEVNFLGGDTKISTRNLVLSLMSASKFQTIFSLGFFILIFLFVAFSSYKLFNQSKARVAL